MNRLTDIYLGSTHSQIVYDPLGRMTAKQVDGTPVFTRAVYDITSKPHAIDAAKTWQDNYPSDDQTLTYTCFDKVKTITEGNNTLEYTYGYDHQRIFMEEHANGTVRTKRYINGCERVTLTEGSNTSTKTLTYLNSPIGIFAVVEKVGSNETLHYILKDHLGSWTTITDSQGNVEQELSFDAWGTLRNAETWTGAATETPMFDRGFTGHEHLYAFGLINMNGRMYDPLMSSFLSVDAYVQSPDNAQNFNRYAYCLNNPLKYVDPSGWLMQGAMMGTPGQGVHDWGNTLHFKLEPRDLDDGFLSEDFILAMWRHGDNLDGGDGSVGGGGSNLTGGQGGGEELKGFELLTQDAWKLNPTKCKFFGLSMIEHYLFGDEGRSAEQIETEWNRLSEGRIPDGNTEMDLYKEIGKSMGYYCYDMGDEKGETNDQEVLNAMQMGDPILLLSLYINNEKITTRSHVRVICGIDYLPSGTAELKVADPMLDEFVHKTFKGLARDEYNVQIYNKFCWFRYSK